MTIQEKIKVAAHRELLRYSWYKDTYNPDTNKEVLSERVIRDILSESDTISTEDEGDSRWWNNETRVCKLGDKYFQYGWASTTGDTSAQEAGWEFSWDSVHEVIPKEKVITVTTYERI